MSSCDTCGGERVTRDFNYCGDLEFCPRCDTTKLVRSKLYLNGKEVEYCVEVNTSTGETRILSSKEE